MRGEEIYKEEKNKQKKVAENKREERIKEWRK